MLLSLCVLQAAALLPPAPEPPEADSLYEVALELQVSVGVIESSELADWRPTTAAQRAVLRKWLRTGAAAQVRMAALLAAGCEAETALAKDCLRAALDSLDEGAALSALLAPESYLPEHAPALAWLALASEKPLSIRAEATGRLLVGGFTGAWPIARSILRTGTAVDERAPWANWERTGRYELPKRLLLMRIQEWLAAHDKPPTDFEPNAAWTAQVEQLARLEESLPDIVLSVDGERELSAYLAALEQLWRVGAPIDEARAHRVAAILMSSLDPDLSSLLDPKVRESVKRWQPR